MVEILQKREDELLNSCRIWSVGVPPEKGVLLRSDYAASMYHMSWDYHVVMMSLVPDYSTTFHTMSHSDSYYYRD
jgi:hypothetical protein